MTVRITRERLVSLLDGNQELITILIREGVIQEHPEGFCATDVDRALASRTLVEELDVNWPGVDIILRLRAELAQLRKRLHDLEEDQ